MKTVSVIVPCRNEVNHIDAFLASVVSQEIPAGYELQIVVADGMSNDGTRERLSAWVSNPIFTVIDNPRRITSCALNAAIQHAAGDIVVRMDVHTVYAPDYIRECIQALEQTSATCVGGPWRAIGVQDGLQRAIAKAFESRLGSGGASSRRGDYSGPVDTVYLGAWRREDLVRLGGFDERLVRNQDDELNLRIWRSGGTVWQSASIRSSYAPRASLRALFRQFFQYGYWKVAVILKHHLPASLRHLLPFGLVLVLALLVLIAPIFPAAGIAATAIALMYAMTVIVSAAISRGSCSILHVALAVSCMHWGYGLGFARGVIDFVVLRKAGAESMSRLTR